MSLLNISVDLDPISCYHRIHALEPWEGPDPIYQAALERLLELFARFGIKATFFVVGMQAEEGAPLLRAALAAGHELANHSFSHPYSLSKLSVDQRIAELRQTQEALQEHCGVRPVGFRAPGYNISADILELLERAGMRYDASIFPCLPYYLAKSAVMLGGALRGRPSGSAWVDPRTLLAPLRPYRPSREAIYRPARAEEDAFSLLEIPIAVLPLLRWPVIGTSLIVAGPKLAAWTAAAARRAHPTALNIELHGIDLVDAERDQLSPQLRAKQPDLRFPLSHKLAVFEGVFERLREHYEFVTCAEMAERLG
ncbi:MAG: polysaccharide deacetylase family protein [Myxococcota bacterium]|jgi:hypothetical protein|nr:polysaccharide deacetylase family protein [Myxococcota bacterium]